MNLDNTMLLDFQNPRQRPGAGSILLLLVGILATVYLAVLLYSSMKKLEALETKMTVARHKTVHIRHKTPLSAAEAQKLRAEIKDANGVMLQLSLPWNALFGEIAASQKSKVALLSIIPDASRRSIKISGEAENLNALLTYLRELQKAKSLHSVYLQKHQVEIRSAQHPVQFTIIASWVLSP